MKVGAFFVLHSSNNLPCHGLIIKDDVPEKSIFDWYRLICKDEPLKEIEFYQENLADALYFFTDRLIKDKVYQNDLPFFVHFCNIG